MASQSDTVLDCTVPIDPGIHHLTCPTSVGLEQPQTQHDLDALSTNDPPQHSLQVSQIDIDDQKPIVDRLLQNGDNSSIITPGSRAFGDKHDAQIMQILASIPNNQAPGRSSRSDSKAMGIEEKDFHPVLRSQPTHVSDPTNGHTSAHLHPQFLGSACTTQKHPHMLNHTTSVIPTGYKSPSSSHSYERSVVQPLNRSGMNFVDWAPSSSLSTSHQQQHVMTGQPSTSSRPSDPNSMDGRHSSFRSPSPHPDHSLEPGFQDANSSNGNDLKPCLSGGLIPASSFSEENRIGETAGGAEGSVDKNSDQWKQHRKNNHKEVERRRRETINEGITELKKIVPGSEKNKGEILKQAVKYIQQLKESETRNIEKWTLEKLLIDQAMQEQANKYSKLSRDYIRLEAENESLKRWIIQLGERGVDEGRCNKTDQINSDGAILNETSSTTTETKANLIVKPSRSVEPTSYPSQRVTSCPDQSETCHPSGRERPISSIRDQPPPSKTEQDQSISIPHKRSSIDRSETTENLIEKEDEEVDGHDSICLNKKNKLN